MDTEILYKEESCEIVGACFEVYRECLENELRLQGISYVPKKPLALEYKG